MPVPLPKVIGKSSVCAAPAVVIVCVPEVAANVVVFDPAVKVTPEGMVILPYIFNIKLEIVPENPVKFILCI